MNYVYVESGLGKLLRELSNNSDIYIYCDLGTSYLESVPRLIAFYQVSPGSPVITVQYEKADDLVYFLGLDYEFTTSIYVVARKYDAFFKPGFKIDGRGYKWTN